MMNNCFAVVGVACLVYAAWQIHPVLAWLTAGVALLAVAIGGAMLSSRKNPEATQTL